MCIYIYRYVYMYIHNGIYSAMRKKKILPFVTTGMDLEGIMLSERSDRERQIHTV